MKFSEYLLNYQPLVYKTFSNAMKSKRISHAYLLSGEKGTPLLETAIFLAKTLLCDNPLPLADEECRYCQRIEHRTFNGFRIIGEEEGTIKKEEVEDLISSFSKTSLEEKSDCVYIINGVENMTVEAVNSLLKFLEEPPSYVHAILTTENIAKVLPTIISRCETIRLLLSPKKDIVSLALQDGIKKEDAELASFFINNSAAMPAFISSDDYLDMKAALLSFLDAISLGKDSLYLVSEKDIIPALSDKKRSKMFFDMLCVFFKETISYKENAPFLLESYVKIMKPLLDLPALSKSLLEIMKVRNLLDLNISAGILLEHVINYISKENGL